jgi:hypothetical protein
MTLCRPNVVSFLFWYFVGIKNDFMSAPEFVSFFLLKFDRRRVIFSDFMSVTEKRIYVDPMLCHFLSDFMSVIEKRLYFGPTKCHFLSDFMSVIRQNCECIFMKYFYEGKFTRISAIFFFFIKENWLIINKKNLTLCYFLSALCRSLKNDFVSALRSFLFSEFMSVWQINRRCVFFSDFMSFLKTT